MIPSSLYCHACGAANATDRSVCFACKQPLQIVASDKMTLLQGRYRVLTQVGKGGFGAVHRAEDTHQHGSIVAVKQINLRGLTPQETIEATDAFNREVSLLSNLSHPNLPHIYDNFTDPEHWYLVMDFIEGETLESYLEAKGTNYTASLDEVLTLGIQLCTVLDYLHTREPVIIFRDLKPANIMRTPAGKLFLIDFGIARSFKPGKLKDTIPFGSPGYAAPEQYGKAQTTPRADIYSLGALLHMLLSGDDPVDNPFHFAPLRIYGVPGLADLETLILRMVQIDANSRPATIVEVKAELQRIADMQDSPRLWHPPVGQTPPALPIVRGGGSGQMQISASSTGQQQLYVPTAQRKRVARRKFLVGSFSIAGLAVIGAGGIANIVSALHSSIYTGPEDIIGSTTANPFRRVYTYTGHTQSVICVAWAADNTRIASASGDGTVRIWTKESVSGANTNPHYDAPKPVYALAWGQGNNADILAFSYVNASFENIVFLWNTAKGAFSSIKTTASDIVEWSHDGKYLVFPSPTSLQIYDVATRTVVRHIPLEEQQTVKSLSWSSDGNYIAGRTQDEFSDHTVVWDVAHNLGTDVSIPDSSSSPSSNVEWSPDGKWLAAVSNSTVYVFAATDLNTVVATHETNIDLFALAWSPDSKYIVFGGQNALITIWKFYPKHRHRDTKESTIGDTFVTQLEGGVAIINSLAWSSEGIAVGADNAYVIEVDMDVLVQ